MFIAFFLPWKLLFDVNAFHICDILLSNPNNISVDLISTGTHNDVFNIQPNTFLHKRIKIGKLWLLCKKPFLSQIDTHTRLFFIIKKNERNDEKDFVIYTESKKDLSVGQILNIFDLKYLIILYRHMKRTLRYCSNDTLTNTVNRLKLTIIFLIYCTF